jgi:hypothetical protein
LSWDIGVRKKPSAERGPNERIEIRQPHTMITPGVRQLMRDGAASTVVMGGFLIEPALAQAPPL